MLVFYASVPPPNKRESGLAMDLYSRGIALPEGTQPKVGPHGITGGEISVMKKEHKVFAFPESEDVESVGMVLKIKV